MAPLILASAILPTVANKPSTVQNVHDPSMYCHFGDATDRITEMAAVVSPTPTRQVCHKVPKDAVVAELLTHPHHVANTCNRLAMLRRHN